MRALEMALSVSRGLQAAHRPSISRQADNGRLRRAAWLKSTRPVRASDSFIDAREMGEKDELLRTARRRFGAGAAVTVETLRASSAVYAIKE